MPAYGFECAGCGSFEVLRPVGEVAEPAPCPRCRREGRRVFTPPGVARTSAGRRRALELEERSAHEPRVATDKRGRERHAHRDGHHHAPPWALSH